MRLDGWTRVIPSRFPTRRGPAANMSQTLGEGRRASDRTAAHLGATHFRQRPKIGELHA
jgi:hypothetical protein